MERRRSFILTAVFAGALIGAALLAQAADRVGRETCAVCHDDVAAAFQKGPHGSAMAAVSPKILDEACETCHGPGSVHADDPSTSNINRHPAPAACLSCHGQKQSFMAMAVPGHVRNGIACLDCHVSGHSAPAAEPMLKAEPSKLCAGCHAAEAGSFRLPYAHREGSKPFECTSCHDIHGENRTGRLNQSGPGAVCMDCHSDKAEPHIYAHPPRDVEGCLSCHQPHGTANPRMLIRSRVTELCIECHTNVPSFHDLSKGRYRNCLNCHVAVHGSNHDPRLFED
jgi:DmsE family decaheme c-type cytochrome